MMTDENTRTIYTGRGKVAETRRAIKQAAKSGEHHHVRVDMHPTTQDEAIDLIRMASGHVYRKYHDWRWRNSGISKSPIYKRDTEYETRMIEWADRIMCSESVAA